MDNEEQPVGISNSSHDIAMQIFYSSYEHKSINSFPERSLSHTILYRVALNAWVIYVVGLTASYIFVQFYSFWDRVQIRVDDGVFSVVNIVTMFVYTMGFTVSMTIVHKDRTRHLFTLLCFLVTPIAAPTLWRFWEINSYALSSLVAIAISFIISLPLGWIVSKLIQRTMQSE